jgi:N-acetylmuramoyl-L-alanine amidase
MPRRTAPLQRPAPLRRVARALTLMVCVVLGALTLLGLGEVASISSLRGLLGARQSTVGLLAGHWQSDSGAVCDDGLREVDITLDVTRRVANLLRRQGYQVQVLPEYAAQLDGFRAEVFLAIHADSCIDMSGFKIARMTQADDPAQERLLVETLGEAYAQATGLQPHPNTITEDMRQYHALRRISPQTPGAIIEIGFMGGDRYLLTQEPERAAVGIANGLIAFMRQRSAAMPVAD